MLRFSRSIASNTHLRCVLCSLLYTVRREISHMCDGWVADGNTLSLRIIMYYVLLLLWLCWAAYVCNLRQIDRFTIANVRATRSHSLAHTHSRRWDQSDLLLKMASGTEMAMKWCVFSNEKRMAPTKRKQELHHHYITVRIMRSQCSRRNRNSKRIVIKICNILAGWSAGWHKHTGHNKKWQWQWTAEAEEDSLLFIFVHLFSFLLEKKNSLQWNIENGEIIAAYNK